MCVCVCVRVADNNLACVFSETLFGPRLDTQRAKHPHIPRERVAVTHTDLPPSALRRLRSRPHTALPLSTSRDGAALARLEKQVEGVLCTACVWRGGEDRKVGEKNKG